MKSQKSHLTHRNFTHGFIDSSFWYKQFIDELIPRENKIGCEISESEVIGTINHLKKCGEVVTQKKVAEVVGCHFTIHKEFVKIYKDLKS